MILISQFSYNPSEEPTISSDIAINNIFGIFGVYIAYYLIKMFLGWGSLVFPDSADPPFSQNRVGGIATDRTGSRPNASHASRLASGFGLVAAGCNVGPAAGPRGRTGWQRLAPAVGFPWKDQPLHQGSGAGAGFPNLCRKYRAAHGAVV